MGQRPRVRARAVLLSAALICACQRGREGGESAESGADHATDHAAAPAPAPSPSPALAPAPSPTPSAPVDDAAAYARDVDRICRVKELSGVETQPELNPLVATAQWLSDNLETDAGRQLVIRINGLPTTERAAAYDAEATRVGLTACPTARAWDKSAAH